MDGFVYTALSLEDQQSGKREDKIVSWKKMHKVAEYEGHKNKIIKFLCVGEFIFSLAEQGEFIIFNRSNRSIIKSM